MFICFDYVYFTILVIFDDIVQSPPWLDPDDVISMSAMVDPEYCIIVLSY